jgi:hypothetical protein
MNEIHAIWLLKEDKTDCLIKHRENCLRYRGESIALVTFRQASCLIQFGEVYSDAQIPSYR